MGAGAQPQRTQRPAAPAAPALPGKAQNIVRHHKLITRAIEAADPDAAQQHLRQHLSGTLSELDRIRSNYPEYLTD